MNKNQWIVLCVRKGTALKCSKEHLENARHYFTKNGYSYTVDTVCEDHEERSYSCSRCGERVITYTEEDQLQHAIAFARNVCTLYYDGWMVDGDTLEIVAAFNMNIQRIR